MVELIKILFLGVSCSLLANIIWTGVNKINGRYQTDTVAILFINFAVLMLPKTEQELYREEWFAFICEFDEPLKRLTSSMGFIKVCLLYTSPSPRDRG